MWTKVTSIGDPNGETEEKWQGVSGRENSGNKDAKAGKSFVCSQNKKAASEAGAEGRGEVLGAILLKQKVILNSSFAHQTHTSSFLLQAAAFVGGACQRFSDSSAVDRKCMRLGTSEAQRPWGPKSTVGGGREAWASKG